ncbi:SET domain-containing protein [Mycena indigotica]|uniref:SET domain-containing protein n=1 Tax=Mycena indigotica TaxID=2126181 RepID=A0A8H6SME2_9AGAR|nr:SET domain-containing protein [Mycena indigotica]KAF7301999.1 SET domain-containing protein [Mycena indigotica]
MSAHTALQNWLTEHGGHFHLDAHFSEVPSGALVIAAQDIAADETIASCPFDLVITRDLALDALSVLLGSDSRFSLEEWPTRQLLSSYLAFHAIVEERSSFPVLAHHVYVDSLPDCSQLRTPLHFSPSELEDLRGSNLHGATIDRERDWRREWTQCRDTLVRFKREWSEQFTWERYLTAATHISSRAFPSTLLSRAPSLSAPDSEPMLLPGIDALNHARGTAVSWVSNYIGNDAIPGPGSSISLVLHDKTPAGAELFNNYGPKPNAELILGYGFSLPENPDDTIVLKIGGLAGKSWEVGRHAKGAEGLWESILQSFSEEDKSITYEEYLDASSMLSEMVIGLLDKLPVISAEGIREEVALMIEHYIQGPSQFYCLFASAHGLVGQRNILEDLIEFAASKEAIGIAMAEEQGIKIVLE